MKHICTAALLLISSFVYAQTDEQVKINKDVWFNFMQAYQDLDASLFNQIHTDHAFISIPIDQNMILIGQEHLDQNLERFNRWNDQKTKQRISFSFLNRVQKDDWAYEVGIYKLTRYEGAEAKHYYGKFNVTLKRVSNIWKIYLDSDTSEDGAITKEDFLRGSLLQH